MSAPPISPDHRGVALGRATSANPARADQTGVEPHGRWHPPRKGPSEREAFIVAVAAGARFDGLLAFRGRAQIDGELRGSVVCRGTLRVGPGARIDGPVEADEVVVLGRLRGDVTARQRIELGATARVTGSIRAPSLKLVDGCWLDGRCEMPPPAEPSEAD
jgi:cytoskeletal protein CcmA (bactofilin family)